MATINVLDSAGSTVALEKPLTPGTAADSASRPVAFSTEGKAQLGSVTETAPATDTASSGLNGRLQRIAQRITTLIANIGDVADAAWTSGSGSHTALLKAIAGAAIDTTTASPVKLAQDEYETVAASQTAQVLGATGGTGDYISGLLVIPATTSPGNVLLLDNATSITVFAGGATSVSNLVPFFIPLGIKSVSGAWKVTTGANVSVIGVGDFS